MNALVLKDFQKLINDGKLNDQELPVRNFDLLYARFDKSLINSYIPVLQNTFDKQFLATNKLRELIQESHSAKKFGEAIISKKIEKNPGSIEN